MERGDHSFCRVSCLVSQCEQRILDMCESLETVLQTDRVCDGWQGEGDVPERVDGGGHALAHLTIITIIIIITPDTPRHSATCQ